MSPRNLLQEVMELDTDEQRAEWFKALPDEERQRFLGQLSEVFSGVATAFDLFRVAFNEIMASIADVWEKISNEP
jgi:hypothetical protein